MAARASVSTSERSARQGVAANSFPPQVSHISIQLQHCLVTFARYWALALEGVYFFVLGASAVTILLCSAIIRICTGDFEGPPGPG